MSVLSFHNTTGEGHHETVVYSSRQTQTLQHREILLNPQGHGTVMCTQLVQLVTRNSSVITLLTPRCRDSHICLEVSDKKLLISRKKCKDSRNLISRETSQFLTMRVRGISFRVSMPQSPTASPTPLPGVCVTCGGGDAVRARCRCV